jgi:DNA-binding transcriptional LysR family regulator
MPTDELDDLVSMAVFASVAELGSFTAAAARLGLVKSVASARVARLERQLGVKLLHRTTRRVSLTPAGAALYPSCAEVARAAGEVRARASGDAGAVRGRLRVNAPVSFGTRFLAAPLASFLARHPDVHVELTLQDDFVDPTKWDVVLRLGHVTDLELVARRLATMGGVVCASPRYLERHGEPRHPLDLVGHACLRYAHVLRGREWRFETPDGPLSVPVDGPVTTTDGSLLVALAREGVGIAVVPWFLAEEAVARGELVVVLRPFVSTVIPCHAVHAHGNRPPARVRAFIEHLVEHFRVPPWGAAPLS